MAVVLKRRRFTLGEYQRMGEAGILSEDDRVELIEGEIVEMTPIGARHAGTVARIGHFFSRRLGERVIVWAQNPIQLPLQDSEPQPDVTLLRPRPDFYTLLHPRAGDVFLLVEVMDTSVERDRRVKLPLYAMAEIPEVWLVDLNTDRVEVYRQPAAGGYGDARVVERGEPLTVEAFPDLVLTPADLLGSDR